MRWKDEDLDEYEDDEEEEANGHGYEGYGEEEEEEEEEEERECKPTQEEVNYLKMRERMKEKIRQKYRNENASGVQGLPSSERNRLSRNNAEFGSFFGPSQPVIAKRVIEESHSMRETQHITSRIPNSKSTNSTSNNKPTVVSNGERKIRPPKAVNEVKSKAEALKGMRDYSFLFSDDADIPETTNDPPMRKPSKSNSTQAPSMSKIRANEHSKPVSVGHDQRKSTHLNNQKQTREGLSNLSIENRSKFSIGSGPGRPHMQKAMNNTSRSTLSSKSPVMANKSSLERKQMTVKPNSSSKKHLLEHKREIQGVAKAKTIVPPRPLPSSSKPQQLKQQSSYSAGPREPPSKKQQPGTSSNPQKSGYSSNLLKSSTSVNPLKSGISVNHLRSGTPVNHLRSATSVNPPRSGTLSRTPQSVTSLKSRQSGQSSKTQQHGQSSRLQPSKYSRPMQKQAPSHSQPKRKPINKYSDEDDDDEAINMIRKMFRYNPNKYQDDDDDSDMEANFDDIMMEENRSSRIARKEDEEQLRLIEEEERQEEEARMRRLAKKRRLG